MPFVHIAAFCQTALQEANGSLSLIRVTDRHMVQGSTPALQQVTVNLTLVIVLKAGNMEGSATLTVRPVDPDGKELPAIKMPVLFEGKERGVGLITQIGLVAKTVGLFWFDVLIEDTLLTRIPLRILYQQAPRISIAQPPTT